MTQILDNIKIPARAKALRYLGYRGNAPDEATASLLEKGFAELSAVISVSGYRKVVSKAKAEHLLIGKDVNRLLADCDRVMISGYTLGVVTDRLIRVAEIRNMAYAVVLDALASALIEEYADLADSDFLDLQSKEEGKLYTTWRFSPGYGDYPIEVQPVLLNFINAEKILGLTVTENYILLPRKSITGVTGLSSKEFSVGTRGCSTCNMRETCKYRKDGITCGDQ